nr:MAG TPA: tail tube protein [Caudoviricetes sp.]
MAKIGFEYIVAAKLDPAHAADKKTVKYTGAMEIGPGAQVNGNPTTSDVKDYGDDRVVETDTSVTGGTISLELNEPTMEVDAFLLGHTVDETKKSMTRNVNDIAPYVGVGFVGKSKRNGARVYKAKIYLKAQFKEANDENSTKQENVTFSHTTLEGNMYALENGDWKDEKEFDTLDEAKAYVDTTLGKTAVAA